MATDSELQSQGNKYQNNPSFRKQTDINNQLYNYVNNPSRSISVSGTPEEQQKAIEGLNLAKTGYGQNLFTTGEDIQRVKDLQRARTEGTDPVSEAIRNSKASVANAQRNLASQGVKGGVAQGAISELERKQNADIAASLYGQQAQNIAAERSLASNTLAGTTALMQGGKAEGTAANMPNAPIQQSFMGTVICTELYNQGYFTFDMFVKDSDYGYKIRAEKPHVYVGYRLWADPVVSLMQKSKVVTRFVAIFAVPWAKNMAGEKNLFGKIISTIGEPICGILGKIATKSEGKYV